MTRRYAAGESEQPHRSEGTDGRPRHEYRGPGAAPVESGSWPSRHLPSDARPSVGRLRRAHQAAHHRAAAGHDRARRWSWPSGACPPLGLMRGHRRSAARWPPAAPTPSTCRRPRHRRGHGAHPEPPAGHRRGHAPGGARLRHRRSRWPPSSCSGALVNLLSAVLAVSALPLLRLRLHALAEADVDPEHRHRRRRRRRARAGRLGGGHRHARLGAVVLFGVIFFWTPPHFWALAIRYRDDYAAADVPMLPAVAGLRTTAVADPRLHAAAVGAHAAVRAGRRTWAASTWSPPSSSAPSSPGSPWTCVLRATPERAMRLFTWSITYVTLLFGAMAVDQLLRTGFDVPGGRSRGPCVLSRQQWP